MKGKMCIIMALAMSMMLTWLILDAPSVSAFGDLEVTFTTLPPTTINAGESYSFQVEVRNAASGQPPAEDVVFEYRPPPKVAVTSISSSVGPGEAGTKNDPSDPATCYLGNMAVGPSVTINIVVQVDPDVPPGTRLDNDVRAYQFGTEDDPPDNQNHAFVTVNLGPADLKVTKIVKPDGEVVADEIFNYTIFVENLGPSNATGVTVTDTMVSDGSFYIVDTPSLPPGYPPVPGVPGWYSYYELNFVRGPDMLPGERDEITVQVRARETQDINNIVNVSCDNFDPDMSNNQALVMTAVTDAADLSITKTISNPPDPWVAGTDVVFLLNVFNNGPSMAENVVVKDYLPFWVTIVSVTVPPGTSCTTGTPGDPLSPLTWNIGTIASGAPPVTATVTIHIDPDYPIDPFLGHGYLENDAVVTSDIFDPDNSDNRIHLIGIVQGGADLDVTKVVFTPGPWYAGTSIQFQLTVTNNGPATASNVVLKDYLPSGVTVDSVSPLPAGASCTTGKPCDSLAPLICNLGNLTAGAPTTVWVTIHIDPDYLGYLENDAVVSSNTFDRNNGNNRAYTLINVESQADLTLTKTAAPDPVLAGNILEYFYNVTNNGPSTARDVVLIDNLPNGVDFISAFATIGSASCTYSATHHRVTCDIGDMEPGDTVNITVRTRVHSDVANNTAITNQAEVSSSTPDPSTPNTDFVDTLVQTQVDLEIQKTSLPVKASTGDQIKYTIRVINHGPSDAQEVNVTDCLPKGVRFEIETLCNSTLIAECPDILNLSIGTLKAGETCEFEIWVEVLKHGRCCKCGVPIGTMMINEVYVESTTTDPILDNNYATAKTLKIKEPDEDGKNQWYLFGQILFLGGLVSAAAIITYGKKRNHNH